MTHRLWIIDPSIIYPEDQGVAEILRGWRGEHRLFRPGLRPGDGPTTADGYEVDGVVLMGSSASVHDSDAWIVQLASWLEPMLDGEFSIPLLGICFGHQLIARIAGARVDFLTADRRKRSGVEYSELAGGRLLPGRRALRVAVSHCEQVTSVPERYAVVASRPGIAIDGLEHERLPIFTFQFHPEAAEEFARHAGIDRKLLDSRLRSDSRLLLDAFRAWIRKKQAGG
jgi:GMP synthase-like glutamine amidotransferase